MRSGLGQLPRRRRGALQIVAGLEQRSLLSAALTQSVFPGQSSDYATFGAAVATDGNFLVVGVPLDDTGATNSGTAYVFNATTGALLATLVNPTPANYDNFGYSVSVFGNTVVVGAPYDDTTDENGGAAYVFNATTGALQATLTSSNGWTQGNFGYSVSVSDNTIVVGKPRYSYSQFWGSDHYEQGRAYVFNATTGALQTTLFNPTPEDYDAFGKSVSISGNTVVIGAPYDDTSGVNSGTAYVFNATTGALQGTLDNPSPANDDNFGYSASVSGSRIVVGAPYDDTSGTDSGQAYMFNPQTQALLATLANPTPAQYDNFGYSVSVSGNTAIVGAPYDDTARVNSGAAYVFNATTGVLQTTLAKPTPTGYGYFGYSVSVSDNTVVVGAPYDTTFGTVFGAAHLFSLQNDSPVITGGGAFHVSEYTTFVTKVVATDSESDTLTYTISGGVDAGLFTINPSTGALAFALPPNYESPQDANRNNVYELTVSVSDGVNPAVTQAFTVTVTDVVEAREFVDPHPAAGNAFGAQVVPLSTGNVVVTSPFDDAGGTDAGAVYLFNGATGELISTLTGSHSNDNIGRRGVTALPNGNFVVLSYDWDNGGVTNAGAVTWGSGTTGVTGVVSAANSLVGSAVSDEVGANGIAVLSNGNYVVVSSDWDNGGVTNAGAVTWGDGTVGVKGVIDATNSLVGNTAFDRVGVAGISVLTNGNYVVRSYIWDNGGATDAGAVTWGDGTVGVKGVVSAANSLVGSNSGDHIGIVGVTALTNGNYVVNSNHWHNAGATNAGAVTWGDGTVGVKGVVNATNSLVGTAENHIGNGGTIALPNGNYVVVSSEWDNGGVTNAGAVTWGSGTAGVAGLVSAANSLVGSAASDFVGADGITVLSNGNYVVVSSNWDNGGVADAGAVTWGDGTSGVKGVVNATNSLVGSTALDRVGVAGVSTLTNGNYVVRSYLWDSGGATDAGAVTWGDGTAGVKGVVSAANSLVGSASGDNIGNIGVTALTNGNYVVNSDHWHNAGATNAGAVTWGNGTTGVAGVVNATNSLVGTAENHIGNGGTIALPNGNYVVVSSEWDNGGVTDAGAVTWGDGTNGVKETVSAANSLVGSAASDFVGAYGITVLSNGNYVVISSVWDNGGVTDAGAVTWGDGTNGVKGTVSAANSLVGSASGDHIGNIGVTALTNGNYVVNSNHWHNAGATNAGAVTWGDGATGVKGVVNATNSLVGTAENHVGIGGAIALPNGNYVVRSPEWDNGGVTNAGAVTWGNGTTGVAGVVSVVNSFFGLTSNTNLQSSVLDPVNSNFYSSFLNEGGGRVRIGSQITPNATPTDMTLSHTTVAENSINGTVVGQLTASDPDTTDTFTFSLTDNAGGRFGISGANIVVADSSLLDFEANISHSVTVQVTDSVGHTFEKQFTINLSNVNEAPAISPQTFSVAEGTANGVTVGTVVASDVDAGDTQSFTITGGNSLEAFAITNAGVITVADATKLDFETYPTFSLTVEVTDADGLSASTTVTINLTNVNESPEMSSQTFSVAEGTANGVTVGTVVANDVDAGDTKSFTITGGNSLGAFAISNAGVITVADATKLDFETHPTFSLTVQVTDAGGLSASTTVTINLTDAIEFVINGSMLNVSGTLGHDVITVLNDAGVIKIDANGTLVSTGVTAGSITGVTISGFAGNDALKMDTSLGSAISGTLLGGAGNDTLISGLGNDTLDGGADVDMASYVQATAGVKVNLALTTVQTTVGAGKDKLSAIENLTGSNYNDTLDGSSGSNILSGGLGNDTLSGGLGADVLDGGDGNDLLKFDSFDISVSGGSGIDSASVANASAAVSLNLTSSLIESVNATTSIYGNMFTAAGATWAVTITGGSGNDTIIGGNLNDSLTGGAGNDVISGGVGNDTLSGGLGADALVGNDGNDTLNFDNLDVNVSGGAGADQAVVNGAIGPVTLNVTLAEVEIINASSSIFDGNVFDATGATWAVTITGGSGNDSIIGGNLNDNLNGGTGDDYLIGGAGNDILQGSAGSDALDGQGGNDTLYFDELDTLMGGAGVDQAVVRSATDAVSVNLVTSQIETVSATTSIYDNVFDAAGATWIVTITGGSGDDSITGGLMNDNLTGGAGNDTLAGGGGNDRLTGGLGADVLNGGDANDALYFDNLDTIFGGSGVDSATVSGATGMVTLNLTDKQIETVTATASTFNNLFDATGATWTVSITGGSGHDTIIGGLMNDRLTGGAGNDLLVGNAGNDILTGGDGSDTISYANASAAVNVNLLTKKTTGGDGNDTLATIENVIGSPFNDTITGDLLNNLLDGGDGILNNDTILGGGGVDSIINA